MGHKYAITDHGVVQAYRGIQGGQNKDIKIIYGVECYLTNQMEKYPCSRQTVQVIPLHSFG